MKRQEGYFVDTKLKTHVGRTEEREIANNMSENINSIKSEKNNEMGFLDSNKIEPIEEEEKIDSKTVNNSSTFSSKIDLPEKKNVGSEETNSGGLNNLIRRMTGFREIKREQLVSEEKNQHSESVHEKDTERDDESKLDIPAFLRRQAN